MHNSGVGTSPPLWIISLWTTCPTHIRNPPLTSQWEPPQLSNMFWFFGGTLNVVKNWTEWIVQVVSKRRHVTDTSHTDDHRLGLRSLFSHSVTCLDTSSRHARPHFLYFSFASQRSPRRRQRTPQSSQARWSPLTMVCPDDAFARFPALKR
jgi:hypothetical protein